MKLGRLVIRLVVGLLFAGHGAQKLFGSFGGHGPDGTGQFFESLGLRPGRRNALAAGTSETVGGALLAAGLFTPLAATALSATMITAIRTVHAANGPWASDGGYEYNLVLLAALFALADAGPGPWSLDHALSLETSGMPWALAQLGAGAFASKVTIDQGRKAPVPPDAAPVTG